MLRMLIYVLNVKNDQKVKEGFSKYAGFIAACINNNKEIVEILIDRFPDII